MYIIFALISGAAIALSAFALAESPRVEEKDASGPEHSADE
jgi:hypothetical protein